MNDFSVHRIIGRGGFGEVYGCRKADTGKMYINLSLFIKLSIYHFLSAILDWNKIIPTSFRFSFFFLLLIFSSHRYAMKCLDKKRIKLKQGETLALNERIMLSLVSNGVSIIIHQTNIFFIFFFF